MSEYKGVLEITDYAQDLIDKGQARIEGANVVWNPGSGNTGIFEWGKFRPASNEESRDIESATLVAGGIAIGIAAVVIVGKALYNSSKAKQDKANRINNNLISCLTVYILESYENSLQTSTKLDLKLAIKEYIDNAKLFKNKVDIQLLKNIEIIMNDLSFEEKFDLGENIIQLSDFIKKNNSQKFKNNTSESILVEKMD